LEKLTVYKVPQSKGTTETPFIEHNLGSLQQMEIITLGDMDTVKLMNRTDTKYILPVSRVPDILDQIKHSYRVLEINGFRISSYETVYYDDPSLKFFNEHVSGKLNRNKVRTRKYLESDLQFLEVKRKTNTGKTKKYRISMDSSMDHFDEEAHALVETYSSTDLSSLTPVLINHFNRITLVNYEKTERVTIDLNLRYTDIERVREYYVPYLAIIEVKQSRFCPSTVKNVLRNIRFKKTGISKYCLGISLLNNGTEIKIYKRKIRMIQKITQHGLIA